ncbi:MAG TPA: PD-(D/E)XK nuclease domain-containing protein, partial [Niastella sp.]
MIQGLNSVISTIPYDLWKADSESIFHVIFHLVLKPLDLEVLSETHSAHGRSDIVIKTEAFIYVLELKLNGSAQEALDQIIEKKYLHPFQTDPRKKIAIGINFSSEKRAADHFLAKEFS